MTLQFEHKKGKAVKTVVINVREFPGGPVVKNPPCNERDAGLISAWETDPISHGHLNLGAATTAPVCHS